jgi:hypothetical protein
VTALEALDRAQAAGVSIEVDGEDLVLDAAAPPPPALLDELKRHKAEIIELLRLHSDGWSAADWRALFDERAGAAQFNNGLARPQAEAHAFACCVAEWLNRHPARSAPGRCLGCGDGDHRHDPLLPYGVESTGHAWLHCDCWPAWYAGRKAEAVAALAERGISAPAAFPVDFGKNGEA